jgi:hypothetical protein
LCSHFGFGLTRTTTHLSHEPQRNGAIFHQGRNKFEPSAKLWTQIQGQRLAIGFTQTGFVLMKNRQCSQRLDGAIFMDEFAIPCAEKVWFGNRRIKRFKKLTRLIGFLGLKILVEWIMCVLNFASSKVLKNVMLVLKFLD